MKLMLHWLHLKGRSPEEKQPRQLECCDLQSRPVIKFPLFIDRTKTDQLLPLQFSAQICEAQRSGSELLGRDPKVGCTPILVGTMCQKSLFLNNLF